MAHFLANKSLVAAGENCSAINIWTAIGDGLVQIDCSGENGRQDAHTQNTKVEHVSKDRGQPSSEH